MKQFVKAAFNGAVRALPKRAAYVTLRRLCDRYGIPSLVIRSESSALIEGSLDDHGLFTLLLRHSSYAESSPNDALEEFFNEHPSGTYIDIGANIGTTLIPYALRNPSWRFYAVEPDLENFKRLQRNLNRNDVDSRVKAFNVALADKTGQMALRRSPGNFGDYRLDLDQRTSREAHTWDSTTVTVETLDTMLAAAPLEPPS
jgi:FkbM family methyltransferase